MVDRRTHRPRRRVALTAVVLFVAVAAGLVGVQPGALGAGSASIIASIPSATMLDSSGCQAGVVNETAFGTILPGTTAVSTVDCAVVFGSSNDTSHLRLFQADGFGQALWRNGVGAPDTTLLGGTGVELTSAGGTGSQAYGLAADPRNGDLVAAGWVNTGSLDMGVIRYLPSGTPDPAFGSSGRASISFTAGNDVASAVTVQSDGKVIVCGNTQPGATLNFGVARFNSNGTPDGTFGTSGMVTTAVGTGDAQCLAVLVQPDGKILTAGPAVVGGVNKFAAVRYNSNGTLDTTFGTGGKVTSSIGAGADTLYSIALQPTGEIVAVGTSVQATSDFAILRWTSAGVLDSSFNGTGYRTYPILAASDIAFAMALQPDGKIVAAGRANNGSNDDFAVLRVSSTGVPDASFGASGIATKAIGASDDDARSLLLQSDGKLMLAGFSNTAGVQDFAIARFKSDGTIDSTFGTSGTKVQSLGSGNDAAFGMVMQYDGKVAIDGYVDNGAGYTFGVLRLAGSSIADYQTTVADWNPANGANMFGACLHAVGGGATAIWTQNGTCGQVSTTYWNAIQASDSASANVASAPSQNQTATVGLLFGLRTSNATSPGDYVAPLTLEATAP